MMSTASIAEQMGVTQQYVNRILASAMAKIRAGLIRICPESELREFAGQCGIDQEQYPKEWIRWDE